MIALKKWSEKEKGEKEKMKKVERIKMVKAMEFIARQINDEEIFLDWWLTGGVADGDIEYGDLSINDNDEAEWYTSDENFSDLMTVFLTCMKKAAKSGGLYCDGITDSLKN